MKVSSDKDTDKKKDQFMNSSARKYRCVVKRTQIYW